MLEIKLDEPDYWISNETSGTLQTVLQTGWGPNMIFNYSVFSSVLTLLGSGSEWPKDQALLLTMVTYLKKKKLEI